MKVRKIKRSLRGNYMAWYFHLDGSRAPIAFQKRRWNQ